MTGCGGGGGTPQNIPLLTAIAPSNAVAGAAAITLALYGSNFVNVGGFAPTVQWNGTTLSSAWISATQMTATIPASALASVGSAKVTVTNISSGGGTSAAQVFTIVAAPAPTTWVRTVAGLTLPDNTMPDPAENIVWDAARGKLYFSNAYTATAPSNTIAVIDPMAGNVTASVAAGNDPDLLSISSDSNYLWVGLDGDHSVQRFLLPGLTKDISFPVPLDSMGMPQQAVSLEAAPTNPHTVALMAGSWGMEPAGTGVYVYDNATSRPVSVSTSVTNGPTLEWLQWGGNESTIYGNQYSFEFGGIATLNVTSTGVSFSSYGGGATGMTFSQFDSANGLLYSYTMAFNPAKGSLAGWFNTSPSPFNTPFGPQTCIADSSLGRYYCVVADGSVWELWVFDLNSYALLDRVNFGASTGSQISPITGYPHHLVRWGNAGLALTTKTWLNFGSGGFYLIDGAAVNPKAAADVAAGTAVPSYSWMLSMTPQQAPAGSGDVSVTINGNNFTPDSTACWHCNWAQSQYLPTNYVSSHQLTATIPAGLLASPGSFPISVFDSGSNLVSTDSQAFTVTSASVSGSAQVEAIDLAGFAMAWDPHSARLYVGTADFDGAYPNSIVAVDGESGSIVKAQTVGADPYVLSVSANGQYLYTGFYGATTLTQLTLPELGSPLTWSLSNPSSSQVYWAGDLKAAPVNPHTTAVTLFANYIDPPEEGGVVIYDDNVLRPNFTPGWAGGGLPYYTLAWSPSDQFLTAAAAAGPLYELQINPSGAALLGTGSDNSFNTEYAEIHSDFGTGLIYSDDGNVADPATQAIVGTYHASGLLAPDSSLNRVFILGQTAAQANTNSFTIQSFDEKAYTPVSSVTVEKLWGSPIQMVRCGTSGLAIMTINEDGSGTPGMIYLVQDSTFVSHVQKDVSRSSKSQELVQQRWKRITKADIAKMMKARSAARLP
jgi:hypothetical protein